MLKHKNPYAYLGPGPVFAGSYTDFLVNDVALRLKENNTGEKRRFLLEKWRAVSIKQVVIRIYSKVYVLLLRRVAQM